MPMSLPGESVQGNETTAAPEKRADVTSLAVAIDMRITTENAAGNGIATVRGIETETVRERGRESTDTARGQGRWVQLFLYYFSSVISSYLSSSSQHLS